MDLINNTQLISESENNSSRGVEFSLVDENRGMEKVKE